MITLSLLTLARISLWPCDNWCHVRSENCQSFLPLLFSKVLLCICVYVLFVRLLVCEDYEGWALEW